MSIDMGTDNFEADHTCVVYCFINNVSRGDLKTFQYEL